MLSPRTILGLLSPEAVRRLSYTLLGWALVPLAELVLLVALIGVLDLYLVLALSAALALSGTWIALAKLRVDVSALTATVAAGVIPTQELGAMAGGIFALLLILSPGFVTGVVGFAILLTRARGRVGASLLRATRIDAKEIYEFLRLRETAR